MLDGIDNKGDVPKRVQERRELFAKYQTLADRVAELKAELDITLSAQSEIMEDILKHSWEGSSDYCTHCGKELLSEYGDSNKDE